MMHTHNLYSVEQLQAVDYLLKRTQTSRQVDLKLVIDCNNTFWYGDFVQLKGNRLQQDLIEYDGVDSLHSYDLSTIPLAYSLFKSYIAYREQPFCISPLENPTNLSTTYIFINNLLKEINPKKSDNPLYPFLFNARTLDGKCQLPFLNLEGEKLNFVSIIEANE